MKANDNIKPSPHQHQPDVTPAFCRKAIALLEQVKSAVFSEYQENLEQSRHLLHLALNEAEALAWQTDYPHLFFPTLASEKAQGIASWQARQQLLQRTGPQLAFAA
jgi:hypothetical protein